MMKKKWQQGCVVKNNWCKELIRLVSTKKIFSQKNVIQLKSTF
jgi:hypothetical protein